MSDAPSTPTNIMRLLSGDEAAARGAFEAGVRVVSAYPGTPSTEMTEALAAMPGVYAEWAPNEKVALDVAIGAAYAGARAMSVMKHVGLNVAMDSLMYVAMTGAAAGLVIAVGDDPGMFSSQNEQDTRYLAKFARIPCLEPSDSQEAKDFAALAFEISERFDVPVILRMTTRICHSSSPVVFGERKERAPEKLPFPRDLAKYMMVPGNARKRNVYAWDRERRMADAAAGLGLHQIEMGDRALGIITSGIGYQYAKEVFPNASVLKLGLTFPLPEEVVRSFAKEVQNVLVVEELGPFLEESIRLLGIPVRGKDIFPLAGELSTHIVAERAMEAGLLPLSERRVLPAMTEEVALPPRPPVLCAGCPHRATFYVLAKMKLPVCGDIGCYSLGVAPPLSAMHTLGCMGASLGVAHGAAKAGINEKMVAVVGDSTFFHSAMPALLNAVYNQSPIITIILDNRSTAMTGHQDNPGTGRTLQGKEVPPIAIEPIVRALGVRHVKSLSAFDIDSIESALKEWLTLDEPSVLIATGPCALLPEAKKRGVPLHVLPDSCNGCTLCFRLGCPAILKSEELDEKHHRPKAWIDSTLCNGCEVCAELCPRHAIPGKEVAS